MSPTATRRVLVHVGTPKTGTSYLQDVLFRNRDALADAGILYPCDRFDGHFLAALDLMRLTWGGLEKEAVGEWDRLAQRVRDWPGTSIISHEILSTATPQQVQRALDSLGADAEVHVVVSARDLVRQLPAEWQENVKHRSLVNFTHFMKQIHDPTRESRIGSWFWSAQELPDILQRWGGSLPPERVHVVTVPRPGSPPDELWRRFSRVFGLDDVELDLTPERANPSMGVPETALLRKINTRATKVVEPPDYRPLVRELLAHQVLSQRTDSPRLALSPSEHAWARGLCEEWVAEIKQRGYDVVGDTADLLGAEGRDFTDPDKMTGEDMFEPALDVITALLVEGSRLRDSEARLSRELHEAHVARDHAERRYHGSLGFRIRNKIVRVLDNTPPGQLVLGLYRRARGRSSRSA